MGQGHKFSGGGSNNGLGTKGGKLIQQKEIKSLLDKDPLLKDLVNSGVKISPKDVVFATKDKSGQTVWLEKGNDSSGLQHIQKHTDQFVAKHNIQAKHLTSHLKNVIKKGKIVSNTQKRLSNGRIGLEKIYLYKGKYYTIGGVGTNGYIVSMYPVNGGK